MASYNESSRSTWYGLTRLTGLNLNPQAVYAHGNRGRGSVGSRGALAGPNPLQVQTCRPRASTGTPPKTKERACTRPKNWALRQYPGPRTGVTVDDSNGARAGTKQA